MPVLRGTVLTSLVVAAAIFAVLLATFHWSTWASLTVALVVAAAGVLLSTRWATRPTPPLSAAPPLMSSAPVRAHQRQLDVWLPSSRPDYSFGFSATLHWYPDAASAAEAADLSALAAAEVVRRAYTFTRERDPADLSLTWTELTGMFLKPQRDPTGQVLVRAEAVSLTLSPEDQRRLDKIAEMRKDTEIWEHEIRREQGMRRYLSDDALKDPASAVTWWLAGNPGQVEKAAQYIGLLSELSRAVNAVSATPSVPPIGPIQNGTGASESIKGSPEDYFASFLDALGFPPGSPRRLLLTSQVEHLIGEDAGYEWQSESPLRPAPGIMEPVFTGTEPDDPSATHHAFSTNVDASHSDTSP